MLGEKMLSTGPVRVACSFDPALDRSTEENRRKILLYEQTRHAPLLEGLVIPGRRIQWFHLRRLPRSVAMEIDATAPSKKAAYINAFRMAVVKVENLIKDNGQLEEVFTPECTEAREPKAGLTRSEMDHFPMEEVYDIGAVVMGRASLRHGKQPYFPPLESSVNALARAQMLFTNGLADENPAAASAKRGKPEENSTGTDPNTERFENGGVPPTDATAKAS